MYFRLRQIMARVAGLLLSYGLSTPHRHSRQGHSREVRMTSSPGRRNRLRELLQTRSLVFGPFISMTDSTVVDLAAFAGYDFILLDAEHGSLSLETIANHVRAARASNLGTLLRVPEGDASYIQRALDMGVDGIEIPHVKSAAEAEWAVKAVRF